MEAMRKLFDGPRHAVTGERIFGGIPPGSYFRRAGGYGGSLLFPFTWVFGKDKDPAEINFGEDIDTYMAALGPYLNAENPDLSKFAEHGGKLLMSSGAADSCVPFHATIDYYERVIEHFGSEEKVRSFFRYYIVPGMGHGTSLLSKMTPASNLNMLYDWVEKGIVPGEKRCCRIMDGKVEIEEFAIYPYPYKADFDPNSGFKAVEGQRGGVERISPRFLPPAKE